MTGNKCLLDTSIIVHAFRSNNYIWEKLDAVREIYVSVTAIGELFMELISPLIRQSILYR